MRSIDRTIGVLLNTIRWLALPIALLLFLQWPLREWIKAYSREANDWGQVAFAVFVAASVVAATRAHVHLATDVVAQRYRPSIRHILTLVGIVAALLPWSVFIGWSAFSMIKLSVLGLERFPDTANPGYFVVKLALGLLVVLIVMQGGVDVIRRVRGP